MRSKITSAGQLVLGLILLVIGFLLGKICTVPGISIQKEINPLHGISILFSLFVVIYVSLLLDRQKEISKIRRELIFKRTEELYCDVNKLSLELKQELNLTDVNLSLKKIGMLSVRVNKYLDLISLKNKDFKENFSAAHKDLRHLMTYTEIHGENFHIKYEDGKVIYSSDRIVEIERKIEELKDSLSMLQISLSDDC